MLQTIQKDYNDALEAGFEVKNDEDLKKAATVLSQIKTAKDLVTNAFDPIIKKAHEAHRQALKQRDDYLNPLKDVESKMKTTISKFLTIKRQEEEQERQRQLEILIQKEAEEKKRLEQEALERARQLETENKQEQANEELEKADIAIQQTEAISTFRQNELAEKKIEIKKPSNISMRTVYKFRIINKNLINTEFMIPDEAKIRKLVTALKKDAEKMIGGIEVYEEQSISNLRR